MQTEGARSVGVCHTRRVRESSDTLLSHNTSLAHCCVLHCFRVQSLHSPRRLSERRHTTGARALFPVAARSMRSRRRTGRGQAMIGVTPADSVRFFRGGLPVAMAICLSAAVSFPVVPADGNLELFDLI